MLKRLLITLLCTLPILAFGQTTTLPTGTTSYTPQFRYTSTAADTLKQIWVFSGSKYNRWYTATEADRIFTKGAGSFSAKLDSFKNANTFWGGTNTWYGNDNYFTNGLKVGGLQQGLNTGDYLMFHDPATGNLKTHSNTSLGAIDGDNELAFGNPVKLFSPPTSPYHIANKIYVDNKAASDSTTNANIYASKDNPSLIKYNYIGGQLTTTMTASVSGFDQKLGELGNVCRVNATTLIQPYSGYIAPYAQNTVYVGLNVSTDNGKTWAKGVQISSNAAEDPNVVTDGTYLYMFVEDKQTVPFVGIKMYTASVTDLTTWTDRGVVLLNGTSGQWDDKDVSSPTVTIKNGQFRLLYEGRRASGQFGAMGLATAAVSLTPTFTKYVSNPILSGTQLGGQIKWAVSLVPDDYIEVNGLPYVTFHASNGLNFVEGVAVGDTSLHTWQDYLGGNWGKINDDYTGKGVALHFDSTELQAFYVDTVANAIVRGQLINQASADFGGKVIKGSDIYINKALTSAGTTTAPLLFRDESTGKIANRLITQTDIKPIFGSQTAQSTSVTGYVGDFNDIVNTQPGYNNYTMRGNATNSPTTTTASSTYFHDYVLEQGATKNGTGNLVQIITPQGSGNNPYAEWRRWRVASTWSGWFTTPLLTATTTTANQVVASTVNPGQYALLTPTGTGSPVFSASPTFTGAPTAPTATAGTNTTQLATTAFVTAGLATKGAGTVTGVTSANADITVATGTTTPVLTLAATQTGKTFSSRSTFNSGWSTLNSSNVVENGSISYKATAYPYYINLLNASTSGLVADVNLSLPAKNGTIATTDDVGSLLKLTGSGTGIATTISIAHGLTGVSSTSVALVTPGNAASAGISYVTADATNINIVYTVAPASGTNNLSFNVHIKP